MKLKCRCHKRKAFHGTLVLVSIFGLSEFKTITKLSKYFEVNILGIMSDILSPKWYLYCFVKLCPAICLVTIPNLLYITDGNFGILQSVAVFDQHTEVGQILIFSASLVPCSLQCLTFFYTNDTNITNYLYCPHTLIYE